MKITLKSKILKLGIFMLIAAFIGLLHVPVNFLSPVLRNKLLWYVLFLYGSCCLVVFILGLLQIIRECPFKLRGKIIFCISWLIFYPSLCVIWFGICVLLCFYTHPWHH